MTVYRKTGHNWIGAYGEKYYRRDYVHIGFQEDDLPGFGKILDVLLVSNIALLQLELCQTLGINCHLSAYSICHTSQKRLVLLPKLPNKQRYYAHSCRGDCNTYIVMKYNVPNYFSV